MREHVADALAAHLHGERLGVEARAVADLADHLHVGQEAHLDRLHALAVAAVAAPARGVEREAARGVAADARLLRVGEELADGVEEADVGRRAGARRLADRRLVDFEHARDRLPALDRLAAARPAAAFLRSRSAATRRCEVLVQHVARERRLARARDAGHDRQAPEREAHVDVLEVVQRRALDLDRRALRATGAARLQRMLQRLRAGSAR